MHQRKRNRLEGFDYSKDNLYFVTSCVEDRVCCFGKVANQKMELNQNGLIAQQQWYWLGQQYSYIKLHAFVVMPNHVHGIIEINRGTNVGTGRDPSLHLSKIKSLSELMGAYKTTTSKKIRLSGYTQFKWQRSFHDHIIRDDRAYATISEYIQNNPMKWNQDNFYL